MTSAKNSTYSVGRLIPIIFGDHVLLLKCKARVSLPGCMQQCDIANARPREMHLPSPSPQFP